MLKRFKARFAVLLLVLLLGPMQAEAGKVGGTMARYALGGAGIGALLGTASASVPYLNDNQPFDFYVGAGAGAVCGLAGGLLFGIIDLATESKEDTQAFYVKPDSTLFAFNTGQATYVGWQTQF